eukprot:scaffold22285_cov70-Cyclotella_meneghiniana.AAC.2
MKEESSLPNMTNFMLTTIASALVAGISAYYVTAWNKKEVDVNVKKEQDNNDSSVLLAQLTEIKQRLNDLEFRKTRRRRTSTSIRSFRTDELHRLILDTEAAEKAPTPKEEDKEEATKTKTFRPNRPNKRVSIDTTNNAIDTTSTDPEEDEETVNLLPRTIMTKEPSDKTLLPKRRNSGSSSDSESSYGDPSKHEPVPIVLISDPGQDLDDEMMFIMARHLVSKNLIELKGVVANLHPSFARARLARGTLDLLGLHKVPVGIGSDGGDSKGNYSSDQFESTASSYIVSEDGEAARGLESGNRLLQRLYDEAKPIQYFDSQENEDGKDEETNCAVKNSKEKRDEQEITACQKKVMRGGLVLVITSSMKDAAIFVRDNPLLFASKTREVIVMGGCKSLDSEVLAKVKEARKTQNEGDLYDPTSSVWSQLAKTECHADSAHNNMFDTAASEYLYTQCQRSNVTLTVVSRYAAYAAKMPRSVYDDIALTGSSIGWRLRNSQRSSIDQLWRRACSDDPDVRLGLPSRCNRKWFIDTFCGGDDDESRCSEDTAWDLVTGFMQYDTLALLAAIPGVREQYFDPLVLPPLRDDKTTNSFINGAKPRVDYAESVDRGDDEVTVKTKGRTSETKHVRSIINRRTSDPGPGYISRALAQADKDNGEIEFLKSLSPLEPQVVPTPYAKGTRNIIGISEIEHNLKDSALLIDLLKCGYRQGILCDHHTLPHLIVHMQLRWDNLADTLMTCLMLRSLWDMRLASVLGVIVTINPSDCESEPPTDDDEVETSMNGLKDSLRSISSPEDQSPSTLRALAETIRDTFIKLGLSHVKFVVVGGADMDEHKEQCTKALVNLYESAPPIGVSLVLTATFTSVVDFSKEHTELFRDKTVRVVHTGGALVWPARWGWASGHSMSQSQEESMDDQKCLPLTEEKILVPDPAAQNHRLDLASARTFYNQAQSLSVPMVILSRHCCRECCIPRPFFEVLGSHGGEVGRRIYESERNSLFNLWKCSSAPLGSAERGNLPDRCDRQWFARTFCAGVEASNDDEVWNAIDSVNLYSPIALLAALPGTTLKNYFKTMPFTVRSATHLVIGLTEEVPPRNVLNPGELRSLVIQSLLSAALANESEFMKGLPPKVPIRMETEQRRRYYKERMRLHRSVTSTLTAESQTIEDEDMWTFSEAARRTLFNRTLIRSSKDLVMPKQKVRKFVSTEEEMQSIGFRASLNTAKDDDDVISDN